MLPSRSFSKILLLLLGSMLLVGIANAAIPIRINFETGWVNWFSRPNTYTTPENTFIGSLYSLKCGPENTKNIYHYNVI